MSVRIILLLHIHTSSKVKKDNYTDSIAADQNECVKQVSDHEINAFYKMGLAWWETKGEIYKKKNPVCPLN